MSCWEKVKRLLGFDSHHGLDSSARRPPAKQFGRLRSWGVLVEDREDYGIPLSRNDSKLAETTISIEWPGRVFIPKAGETIVAGDPADMPPSSKPGRTILADGKEPRITPGRLPDPPSSDPEVVFNLDESDLVFTPPSSKPGGKPPDSHI